MVVVFVELGRDIVSLDRNKTIFIGQLLNVSKARSQYHESPITALLNFDILLILAILEGKAHPFTLISELIN